MRRKAVVIGGRGEYSGRRGRERKGGREGGIKRKGERRRGEGARDLILEPGFVELRKDICANFMVHILF